MYVDGGSETNRMFTFGFSDQRTRTSHTPDPVYYLAVYFNPSKTVHAYLPFYRPIKVLNNQLPLAVHHALQDQSPAQFWFAHY